MKIGILNGPNLNLLGKRQPEIYGAKTLEEINNDLLTYANAKDLSLVFFQSNHEGEFIDFIHQSEDLDGIIMNPGAFMSYSYAIRDAIASVKTDIIEVHISNIYSRETFRQHSVTAPVTAGQVTGFGDTVYKLALNYFILLKGE
ncbi:type II 3-dehydroquinate dehydratase [Bacillus cereus]|uniref:type II 3-dehydroquinate dehydratase n=1 Tax=Bacillus cereus TaxID=1396 RepID=UPI002ED91FFA